MTHYRYDESGQLGSRAAIGLIVLSTDETLEHELHQELFANDVAIYVSRVPMGQYNTPEALRAMGAHITQSAALLPARVRYRAIGYGCTSASAILGHDAVDALLAQGREAKHYTNPLKALEHYLAQKRIRSLDILSPYRPDTLKELITAIEGNHVSVNAIGSFNEIDDAQVARIAPASIKSAAVDLAHSSTAEALFISCTNLRTLGVLEEIENETGKTVISSNQLLAWHLAELSGLQPAD